MQFGNMIKEVFGRGEGRERKKVMEEEREKDDYLLVEGTVSL